MDLAIDAIGRAKRTYYRICWVPSCIYAVIYCYPVASPVGITAAGCVVIPFMIAISAYLLARGSYLVWWAIRLDTSVIGLLLATVFGSWVFILSCCVFVYGYFVLRHG